MVWVVVLWFGLSCRVYIIVVVWVGKRGAAYVRPS